MHMIDGDAELHDKFMIKITTRFSTQTFTTVSQCYRVACADANWCTVRTMSLPKKLLLILVSVYMWSYYLFAKLRNNRLFGVSL